MSSVLLGGCSRYSSTIRVFDGRHVEGRPIQPKAYAEYAQGAALEASGQLTEALRHYHRARDLDQTSAELSTAIGRVECRLRRARADRAFLRALRLDAQYAPAWRERARCALRAGRTDFAVKYARQAQAWAPDELETTLTLVVALQHAQQPEEAFEQLRAHVVRHPDARGAWRAMHELAARQGRSEWQSYAAARLQQWEAPPEAPSARPRSPAAATHSLAPLEAALSAGDDARAQALATDLRVSPTRLGFLALEVGRVEFAAQQARLVSSASPNDADAYVLALAAAHRGGDAERVAALLNAPPAGPPSTAAIAWLMRVIEERTAALP